MRLVAIQTEAQAHTTVTVLAVRLSDHPRHLQYLHPRGRQPNKTACITEVVLQLALPALRHFDVASRGMVRIWTGMVMGLLVSRRLFF